MSTPTTTILSGTTPLPQDFDVLSVEVRKEIDRVPEARIVLVDGSVAERKFKISDDKFFTPGNLITIKVRMEGPGKPDIQLFKGLVVRQAVEAGMTGSELRVELRDAAHVLTRQRRSEVWTNKADHEVFNDLVGKAHKAHPKYGIATGTVDQSLLVHKELVQYRATDWDFLLARADAIASVVVVDDGIVSLRSLTLPFAGQPLKFQYGLDEGTHEVELELDGGQQWQKLEGLAWDPAKQALTAAVAAADVAVPGVTQVKVLASSLGGASGQLLYPGPLASAELGPWATGRMARSRLSLLRGRLLVEGRADVKTFDRIALDGIGKRFDGELLVGGVIHRVDARGWRTELLIGLSPEPYAAVPDLAELPAGGLLPPVTGLQIGVVDGFLADPADEHRIKIALPGKDLEKCIVWARVAVPDAGNGRGINFWPELNDEVIVGFLAGDPRQAVVLGSLHSSKNLPPKLAGAAGGPSQANDIRALVSRAGVAIELDDKKKALRLATPGGNKITVDDDAQSIVIADQHGNKITMDANGIKIVSAKDLSLEASGNVKIKGAAVDVQ